MPTQHAEFEVHVLSPAGQEKARAIRDIFDDALNALEAICPEGRPMSLVRTKLQEACYFAKTAMAEKDPGR